MVDDEDEEEQTEDYEQSVKKEQLHKAGAAYQILGTPRTGNDMPPFLLLLAMSKANLQCLIKLPGTIAASATCTGSKGCVAIPSHQLHSALVAKLLHLPLYMTKPLL